VTYGAGGSTCERTVQACEMLRRDFGFTVMPHLTCVGQSYAELDETADRIHAGGFRNLMALRGDPPRGQTEFTPRAGGPGHASDLVALLKARHADFCLGVAGYPEMHPEAASPEADLAHLKLKVDAGAAFIVTQLFFDNSIYYDFVQRCRAAGIAVPIVPGLMPVLSLRQIQSFTARCGAGLPAPLRSRLEAVGDNTDAAEAIGVDWAIAQIRGLQANGAPGCHLYVLNRSKAALAIATGLAG